jgi:D-3-phosphoglycerate dehydrogenase
MGDDMKYVHCLNKISPVGLSVLPKDYTLTEDLEKASAILVRSANMHEMKLPASIHAIARAGAGVNNIPLDLFAKQGIVVFNTPGANRNAVKEIILAGMLIASRDIVGGINWIKDNREDQDISKSVEKAKSQFGGTEIAGKTIGIVGLGAIGMELAKACIALGMKVIANEPNLAAIDRLSIPENMMIVKTKEEMLSSCDFISLNLPLLPQTKHMINEEAFKQMKDGVVLLNFARDQLVDEEVLEKYLENGKVRTYVTDFPNPKTVIMNHVIAIPHLGASTEEAEDNCASMAVHQLVEYIECGNIINAVNFPNATLGEKKHHRITLLADRMLMSDEIVQLIEKQGIIQSTIKSNSNYQTMIFDLEKPLNQDTLNQLSQKEGLYKIHQC